LGLVCRFLAMFNPADSQIYRYLMQYHTGRSRPVKARELAAKFNTTIRDVNEEIRQLRKAMILVGSSKVGPSGYYIPANEEEAKVYLSSFKDELFDMLQTYNKQKRARKVHLESLQTKNLFRTDPQNAGQLIFV